MANFKRIYGTVLNVGGQTENSESFALVRLRPSFAIPTVATKTSDPELISLCETLSRRPIIRSNQGITPLSIFEWAAMA